MRILIVDTFYYPYLDSLYSHDLANRAWIDQHLAHFQGGFGTGNSYSHGLSVLGIEALEIVSNSVPLQLSWAKEYRPDLVSSTIDLQHLLVILEAQIHWWQPDVLYIQDINWVPNTFLAQIQSHVSMIVGQNACPLQPDLDLSNYHLMLTSLPHYVEKFKSIGIRSEYFPIGFDDRLLRFSSSDNDKSLGLTFVGGLGGFHNKGTQYLEDISRDLPLQVWGYGGENLPQESNLYKCWQGEAWAEDMYRILSKSQITINRHIDIAEGYANNMRLYEATGMGACLVTDSKSNLATLFEPDVEIVTYSSSGEAISKIKSLLENPKAASEISRKGQIRTLRDHNYRVLMEKLLQLVKINWPSNCNVDNILSRKIPSRRDSLLIVCSQKDLQFLSDEILDNLRCSSSGPVIQVLTDSVNYIDSIPQVNYWTLVDEKDLDFLIINCLEAFNPSLILLFHRSPLNEYLLMDRVIHHSNQKRLKFISKRI